MSSNATPIAPTDGPGPHRDRPWRDASGATAASSRSAGLLTLVRNLIAFGQALLHTLQAAPATAMLSDLACRFGSREFAVIVARITRGLMLASALDDRLVRNANRLHTPRARTSASEANRKRPAHIPPVSHQEDDRALLARLPTAQEIAARVRSKPIGIVLESICHDLGITCEHPLWSDLQQAILGNGGSIAEGLNDMLLRAWADYVTPPANPLPAALPAAMLPSTGPIPTESFPTESIPAGSTYARAATGPP